MRAPRLAFDTTEMGISLNTLLLLVHHQQDERPLVVFGVVEREVRFSKQLSLFGEQLHSIENFTHCIDNFDSQQVKGKSKSTL